MREKNEIDKILKAAEKACYDAMFEVHRQARKHGTTVVSEINGVTLETQALTDGELRERHAKIKQHNQDNV